MFYVRTDESLSLADGFNQSVASRARRSAILNDSISWGLVWMDEQPDRGRRVSPDRLISKHVECFFVQTISASIDNLKVFRVLLFANQLGDIVTQSQFDKLRAVLVLP